MAYTQEYYGKFTRGSNTYQVDIESDGFGGSATEISALKYDPVQIKRRGNRESKDGIVNGSELTFNFMSSRADASAFDTIFDSDYKDYRISYYKNTVLQWRGWLRPENFSREFVNDQYEISLSATDGLGDLKDQLFLNGTSTYTDVATILTNIKRAISLTDIELDFKVQCNTFENDLMTGTECPINEVAVDTTRFVKVVDGRQTAENASDVLEKLLTPFDCTIQQSGGYWWVINKHEYNSPLFTYTYSSLAESVGSVNDLRLDISDYKFKGYGEAQRIAGVKTHEVTFKNKNLGASLITNGDFGSGTTGWSATNCSISVSGGELRIQTEDADLDTDTYVESNSFAVTSTSVNDKLLLRYSYRLHDLISGYDPLTQQITLRSELYDTAGLYGSIAYNLPQESEAFTVREDVFNLPTSPTGNLTWRLTIDDDGTTSAVSIIVAIDDVTTQNIREVGGILTTDSIYTVSNSTSSALDITESEIVFGDAFDSNDQGALTIGSVLTGSWKRYGKTEDYLLQNIKGMNAITDGASFKNLLRVTVMDESDLLYPHYYYTINSKDYRVVTFDKAPQSREVVMQLEEVLITDPTFAYILYPLTSVDGTSTPQNASAVSAIVNDHGGLSGLGDDDHTQYHNDTRGDARYYTKSAADTRYVNETDAVSTNTASKVVKRDGSGNFSAGTITVTDIIF